VANFCVHGNEHSGSVKLAAIFDMHSDYQVFK
jgi:hypothetical protein